MVRVAHKTHVCTCALRLMFIDSLRLMFMLSKTHVCMYALRLMFIDSLRLMFML